MKSKMILVEWDDSNIIHGWRLDDEQLSDVAHCRIIGLLKGEDSQKIEVAMGDSDCGSKFETLIIPTGSITKIKKLRIR